jgi:hypothetical protein
MSDRIADDACLSGNNSRVGPAARLQLVDNIPHVFFYRI